ncbi:hypothetical protein NTH_03433 [Nitratireductor thuwali]|uniref:Outer membrane protein beta-barrel domain-containing protein n=1 Tax=Nitratireductor thuwali TaxID=2267699 RepID=A0ABY5MNE7_9HYPH|nr:hypothetical protein NTH_03433 [Nitratireductor thuwali]
MTAQESFGGLTIACALFLGSMGSMADAADLSPQPPCRCASKHEGLAKLESGLAAIGGGTTGYVEGHLHKSESKLENGELKGAGWALRGTVHTGLPDGWNIQLDGAYHEGKIDDLRLTSFSGTLHAYQRHPDRYALGAFLQGSKAKARLSSLLAPPSAEQKLTDTVGGLEGAYFLDNMTLIGKVGFGKSSLAGLDADHLLAEAGIRYYYNDNIRFDLEGGIDRLSSDEARYDVTSLSALANYRFDERPFSVFAGYRHETAKVKTHATSDKVRTGTLMAGARFHFGSGSLKEEERHGPLW